MAGKIELGDLAKDLLSGFTGVVKSISKYEHNCDVIGLQPQELRDGKPIPTEFFDAPGVEVVKKQVISCGLIPMPMIFNFDDMVKDTVTDFKGTVIGYCQWLNGCTRVAVQTAKLKDGNPVDFAWFPMTQLKLVKAGKGKRPITPAPLTEGLAVHEGVVVREQKPGGPMPAPKQMGAPR